MTETFGFVHRFEPGPGPEVGLLLHGTGGDENDLIPLGRALLPDSPLLSPRGQVLENGMPRFFRRLAMGVFDVDDLKLRASHLATFASEAVTAYEVGDRPIVAIGYSNGANVAAAMMLLHPGVVDAAILFHGMVPFEPEGKPDLSGTAVLVTGGERDTMVPRDHVEQLAGIFRGAGASVDLRLMPGGHELTSDELSLAQDWLARSRKAWSGDRVRDT